MSGTKLKKRCEVLFPPQISARNRRDDSALLVWMELN